MNSPMNPADVYAYLVRTRRDLWAALEQVPDDVLSRPMLDGERFHSIKDLVFHVAAVEDGWLHEDIRRLPVHTPISRRSTPRS
ncbi:DinB family protein [Gemmatimonas sp.]|uniref:DinB family protein n=1 Tax=Gemmatimonas sp. TaxID=1962908 RepID=UPI00286D5DE2|nr:DinB family protein [Gemmatimonas sp.]